MSRQTKELKSENERLRKQLESLNAEFRQFKQDVHDGKIGRPAKQMQDSTTSSPNLPIYAAASIPMGSRLSTVAYAERNGMHYLSLSAMQETGTISSGRNPLPRIEEREREKITPNQTRTRSDRKRVLEEERGTSDLPTASDTEWSVAGSRRRRRRRLRSTKSTGTNSQPSRRQPPKGVRECRAEQRPPRSAAVAVRIPDGKISYAEAMKKARREVDLEGMNLGDTRIRRDVTGGLLIQIPGKEGRKKARQLQNKLQEVLGGDVRVTIPSKRAEIRITGFDDSVTEEEILEKVASVGGCSKDDVKMGAIRQLYSGLCAVWVQCLCRCYTNHR